MRAVIIATGQNTNLSALNERHPIPLLPLGDRPIIQHVVETLVDRGVTEFDFVLNHLPEKIEHFLGTGARWGSRFRFHLARDASRPYNVLNAIGAADANAPVLMGHADRLPQLPETLCDLDEASAAPRLYCLRDASALPKETEGDEWTGWAWLSKQFITTLPGDLDEAAFESHLRSVAIGEGAIIEVPQLLRLQSYEDLLAGQSAVLTKEFPGLMPPGFEAEAGIWLSRNVSLHPTASLVAPVFIGENCRIGMGTRLGPNAVVGNNCVLDARCTAVNSAIFPGSYVGEALELEDVIIDKNLLVNARLGAAVPVTDDFILGSLSDNQIRAGVSRLLSQAAAVVLLAITWPVLLATAIYLKLTRRGPVVVKREYLSLPSSADQAQWRTFQLWSFQAEGGSGSSGTGHGKSRLSGLLLWFLPALINVARGELCFVGVGPRTEAEVKLLSHDWQALYLCSKAGIVTEAEILYGDYPEEDELYSAEAVYSTVAGWRHDLKLLLSYFGRLLKASPTAPENHQEYDAESATRSATNGKEPGKTSAATHPAR